MSDTLTVPATAETPGSSTAFSVDESSHREQTDYVHFPNPKNISLPDIDDTSMKNVSNYVEFYRQDLLWSFASDSFFCIGGILYVALSLWDFLAKEPVQKYYTLNALAPLVFIFNSLVDILWALHIKERNKIKRGMTEQWVESTSSSNQSISSLPPDGRATMDVEKPSCRTWYSGIRKHIAHRRTILAASTFGIAAVLAFFAVIFSIEPLGTMSDHTYILSAVIAITGKRTRPWLSSTTSTTSFFMNDPEMLEDLGDLLFLIGNLLDFTLDDFGWDKPILMVFASVLWLIDSLLYMWSDVLMARKARTHRDAEGSGHGLI
jgi:hypothetical protein